MKKKWWILNTLFVLLVLGAYMWWSYNLPVPNVTTFQSDPVGLVQVYDMEGSGIYKQPELGTIHGLRVGTSLLANTSVRTFESTHITFLAKNEKNRIEVGPHSEFAITGDGSSLTLTVLQGEVYVSLQGGVKEQTYTVKTNRLTLTTTNGDFLLVAGDREQSIDVYRGFVNVEAGKKSARLEKDQFLISTRVNQFTVEDYDVAISTPFSHDKVLHSEEQLFKTRFAWSSSFSTDGVRLLLGAERGSLIPAEGLESNDIKPNELLYFLPLGVHYWKLQIPKDKKSKDYLKTPVMKIIVRSEKPTQLIEPMGALSKSSVERQGGILFRWSNPSRLERLLLEISTDRSFSKPEVRQPLVDGAESMVVSFDKVGDYFWRINGFRHDSSELITSAIGTFEVRQTAADPEILFPENSSVITTRAIENGEVIFQWGSHGLAEYDVEIVKLEKEGQLPVLLKRVSGAQFNVTDLAPGKYRIVVKVVGQPTGDTREFEVVKTKKLKLKQSVLNTAVAELDQLKWEEGPDKTSVYKVKIWSFFPVQSSKKMFQEWTVSRKEFSPDLPEDGIYTATVQALDKNQKVLAESDSIVFKLKP